ncbi:hypothetical protein BRAS3809_2490011 [Bradyrhizobium sp. STM 3809]|nr:hypothetical protein BRAS3809_2490011 [Bradyrhizobium sp. STM 3809]
MNIARTSGLGGLDDDGVHMNELIEPLARMAGIDRAVAETSSRLLPEVLCNQEPERRFADLPGADNDWRALNVPIPAATKSERTRRG